MKRAVERTIGTVMFMTAVTMTVFSLTAMIAGNLYGAIVFVVFVGMAVSGMRENVLRKRRFNELRARRLSRRACP